MIFLRPGRKRQCAHKKHAWQELDWGLFHTTGITDTPCVVCSKCGAWMGIYEVPINWETVKVCEESIWGSSVLKRIGFKKEDV